MAIWEALVDGDKRRLNDDGTLFLLQVFGVGLPPARRLKTRSPQQHGSTDLGFRYDEREMRLGFFFNALNETAAVAKRDELYSFWRSLSDIPIQLRYTREDNSVRQIDCHVVGVMDMPWNPDENQNGLQNFVVQVEAANPLWYDPTADVVSFTEDDNPDWWLGLETIDAANVLTHVENPAQGEGLGVDGTPGSSYTIFFLTTIADITPSANEVAVRLKNVYTYDTASQYMVLESGGDSYAVSTRFGYSISGVFDTGQHSYFLVNTGSTSYVYRDDTLIGLLYSADYGFYQGGETVWRASTSVPADPWTPELPYAAVYNIALSETQRAALIANVIGIVASKTITYLGSFLTYPIITITGPITDPVLTNVSTGEDLDFTGITIAGGDTYTIDCRFGYKTVKNAAGTNKIADLTAASDLATFHLGADPEVSGGANAFTLTGTSTDANTTVTVTYNERFVGA